MSYREEKADLVAELVITAGNAGATVGRRELGAFMVVIERAIHLGKFGYAMTDDERQVINERFGALDAAPAGKSVAHVVMEMVRPERAPSEEKL